MENIFTYPDDLKSSLPLNVYAKKVKDKHGKGLRGLLIAPNVPAYRNKVNYFENLVIITSLKIQQKLPQVGKIEFGIQNVPPSDPAPWEGNDAVLGRLFDQDIKHNLPARIVLYRLPIQSRAKNKLELKNLVEDIICQQVSYVLNIPVNEVM